MAHVQVDSDNSLVVQGAYEQRTIIADLGGCWDAIGKVWRIVFTVSNFEALLNAIPDISVSSDLEQKVKDQIEKESKLEKIRSMSKQDLPVCLHVPGLKGQLYNYQKLGIMYATTNGVGLLLADEMGLGKGQVVGSNVYIPTGKVPIETLKVGDMVVGRNGRSVMVTGVFHKPVQDIYRVSFNDGFHLDVDGDHLWYVESANQLNTTNT